MIELTKAYTLFLRKSCNVNAFCFFQINLEGKSKLSLSYFMVFTGKTWHGVSPPPCDTLSPAPLLCVSCSSEHVRQVIFNIIYIYMGKINYLCHISRSSPVICGFPEAMYTFPGNCGIHLLYVHYSNHVALSPSHSTGVTHRGGP